MQYVLGSFAILFLSKSAEKVLPRTGNNDLKREVALTLCFFVCHAFDRDSCMLHIWLLDEREPARPAITVQPVSGSQEEGGGGACQTLALKSLLKHENTFLWALCIAPFFPFKKKQHTYHTKWPGAQFIQGLYSETGYPIGMERNFVCSWCRHNCRSQVIDLSLSALSSWLRKSIIGF